MLRHVSRTGHTRGLRYLFSYTNSTTTTTRAAAQGTMHVQVALCSSSGGNHHNTNIPTSNTPDISSGTPASTTTTSTTAIDGVSHKGGLKGKMSIAIRSAPLRSRMHLRWSGGSSDDANHPPPQNSVTSLTSSSSSSEAANTEKSPQSGTASGEKKKKTATAHHISTPAPATLHSISHFTEPVKRIILLRNGRSLANEDVSTYVTTPDWRIPLVEEGKRQCIESGRQLAELIGDEPVYLYYSPYIRSRQSLRYVLQGYDEVRMDARVCARSRREWWDDDEDGSQQQQPHHPMSYNNSSSDFIHKYPLGDIKEAIEVGADLYDTTTLTPPPSSDHHKHHHQQRPLDLRPITSAGGNAPVVDYPPPGQGQTNRYSDTSLVLGSGTGNRIIGVREDVRLRDGDIGRYTSTRELLHHLEERERYSRFFYRFPYGESGADVCDRVTSFLDAFQRERVDFPMDTNVVIITHGLTVRMFIKRWFHLTVDTFHRMSSPPPGSLSTLTRLHHRSCFRLDEGCVDAMKLPLSLNENNGYKYRNKQLLGSMSSGAPYM